MMGRTTSSWEEEELSEKILSLHSTLYLWKATGALIINSLSKQGWLKCNQGLEVQHRQR